MTNLRALVVALAVPALAGAQDASSRWSPWVGCWTAADGAVGGPITCVVPGSSAEAADLVTVSDDAVIQRSTVTADGVARPIDAEGCRGTETARFSADGSRVFVTGEIRCGDGPEQRTTGVLSISESGQWVDVHGTQVGAQHSLRVRRSRAAVLPEALPEEMRRAIASGARAVSGARLAAALPLSVDRVLETSAAVSDRVAEAWLLESSRDASTPAPVTARQLVRLEESGAPRRVIDVVVALSYPKHFQVALTGDGRADVSEAERAIAQARPVSPAMYNDVFGYSLMGYPRCYTYACYANSWDRYSWQYGLAGWNSYGGWGMYPGWGYNQPIIIVRPAPGGGGTGGTPPGGRAEKGAGYRRSGGTGEPATPRATNATSVSGGSSSARGTSSGSSSGGETKTRTAKPRNP